MPEQTTSSQSKLITSNDWINDDYKKPFVFLRFSVGSKFLGTPARQGNFECNIVEYPVGLVTSKPA